MGAFDSWRNESVRTLSKVVRPRNAGANPKLAAPLKALDDYGKTAEELALENPGALTKAPPAPPDFADAANKMRESRMLMRGIGRGRKSFMGGGY